jgi:hypothetical protein
MIPYSSCSCIKIPLGMFLQVKQFQMKMFLKVFLICFRTPLMRMTEKYRIADLPELVKKFIHISSSLFIQLGF